MHNQNFERQRSLRWSPVQSASLNKVRISKNTAKFDANRIMSFPVEWLPFLFIGKPDYILLGTKNAFNSGQEVPNQSNIPEGMTNRGTIRLNVCFIFVVTQTITIVPWYRSIWDDY